VTPAFNVLDEQNQLQALPDELRRELFSSYRQILRNFRERRWEPAELNGGKLCEVVFTILRGYVDGKFPNKSTKPKNMVDACRELEQAAPSSFSRSVRIQIPRMLVALYEIRNNRGVGHVGGDVDPNHMDALCVLEMAKWVLSELVRIFHAVSTEKATAAVESIVERTLPIVWEVAGKRRVLEPQMKMKDKALVLLYHCITPISEADLVDWVEHSNISIFRRDVLRPAHKQKLLEYDSVARNIQISPRGIEYVESSILRA
jgi:hypothetical protein